MSHVLAAQGADKASSLTEQSLHDVTPVMVRLQGLKVMLVSVHLTSSEGIHSRDNSQKLAALAALDAPADLQTHWFAALLAAQDQGGSQQQTQDHASPSSSRRVWRGLSARASQMSPERGQWAAQASWHMGLRLN